MQRRLATFTKTLLSNFSSTEPPSLLSQFFAQRSLEILQGTLFTVHRFTELAGVVGMAFTPQIPAPELVLSDVFSSTIGPYGESGMNVLIAFLSGSVWLRSLLC